VCARTCFCAYLRVCESEFVCARIYVCLRMCLGCRIECMLYTWRYTMAVEQFLYVFAPTRTCSEFFFSIYLFLYIYTYTYTPVRGRGFRPHTRRGCRPVSILKPVFLVQVPTRMSRCVDRNIHLNENSDTLQFTHEII